MGAGDLFELLIALAIIAFGLLGAGGRKKEQQARQKRQERQRQQARPPSADRAPTEDRDPLLSEIDRLLRGQVPQSRPVPPPAAPEPEEAVSLEPLETEWWATEGASLEQLEIDSEARHDRFHEKYVRPLKPTPVTPAIGRTLRPVVRAHRIPLRQAVIWREILGPPKGLQ